MAKNRTIGLNGAMPWTMRSDLRWFKSVTTGKPVVMGRKTFASIGRPLPGRTNIIVTRQTDYSPEGALVTHSLDEALLAAQNDAATNGADEICIIGGGEIYASALPLANRIYLTTIEAELDGDTWFPQLNQENWSVTNAGEIKRSERDDYDARLEIWDRVLN